MQSIIKKILIITLVIISAYGMSLIPRSSAGKNSSISKFVKAKNDRITAHKQEKINDGDSTYYHRFIIIF